MLRYVSRTLQLGGFRSLQLEDLAMAVTVVSLLAGIDAIILNLHL